MNQTKYLIKFTDTKHKGDYLECFSVSAQLYRTSKLPSNGYRFEFWTEAQRICFELNIDLITDIVPLPSDYPVQHNWE